MSNSRLEREIREQPEALERLLAAVQDDVAPIAAAIARRPPSFALIAARGTSDNAARYAQYVFGGRLGLPVALAAPALTSVYGSESQLTIREALVIGISQSGQSPDIVAVLEAARSHGSPAVAITNDLASPLADAADFVIDLRAGEERAVAATKTYTTSLAAIAALAAAIGGRDGAPDDAEPLRAIPDLMAEAIALAFADVPALDDHRSARHVLAVGRGVNLATACETALKVRELCAVVAEGFSPADLLHGPIAATLPGTPALVTAFAGPARESIEDVVAALEQRSAEVTVITDRPGIVGRHSILRTPPVAQEWLTPLVAVVPGQVYALRQAVLRGRDVDQPVGLTKVTSTF